MMRWNVYGPWLYGPVDIFMEMVKVETAASVVWGGGGMSMGGGRVRASWGRAVNGRSFCEYSEEQGARSATRAREVSQNALFVNESRQNAPLVARFGSLFALFE